MLISINSHSSIQVDDLFFDPYNISMKPVKIFDTIAGQFLEKTKNLVNGEKAKFIFLTHTHYDHLSISDIKQIADKKTTFVATKDAETELNKHFFENPKFFIKPNETIEFEDFTVNAIASYNLNKDFHKKEFGWVGYKITKQGETFAVVGDTDLTPELENLTCDILFVPIGGTYTMTADEAAEAANKISPKIVVPTHYGSLVGNKKDEETFLKLLDKNIKPVVLIN